MTRRGLRTRTLYRRTIWRCTMALERYESVCMCECAVERGVVRGRTARVRVTVLCCCGELCHLTQRHRTTHLTRHCGTPHLTKLPITSQHRTVLHDATPHNTQTTPQSSDMGITDMVGNASAYHEFSKSEEEKRREAMCKLNGVPIRPMTCPGLSMRKQPLISTPTYALHFR